jgi:hypothetical protein
MFRKRRSDQLQPAPVPPGAGPVPMMNQVNGPYPPAAYPPPAPSQALAQMPQPGLPARQIALALLSADYRRAEELLRTLDYVQGNGRYTVTWVGTIEDLFTTLGQRKYDACMLDLGSPQVARLEGNGYRALGNLPYLAVLTTPSLSDGDPLLQQLDARGYYGYVGYPFDGRGVNLVLMEIFKRMAQSGPPAPPTVPNGQQTWAPAPNGVSAPPMSGAIPGAAPMPPTPVSPTPVPPPAYNAAPPPYNTAPSVPAASAPPTMSAPTQRPPAPEALPPTIPVSQPMAGSGALPPTIAIPQAAPPAPAAPQAMVVTQAPPPAPTIVTPQPPPMPTIRGGSQQMALETQIVRHRGLFVCWSPFDGAQRTSAALNMATALAFGGFRTLVGEIRRPSGPLCSYLHLTDDELTRSLLAAAYASERLAAQKGYVIDQELLENHLLNAIPLDPRSAESPEIHFFLSGSSASPQQLFNVRALDPSQSAFVPELLQMIRQYWDFAFIVVGSSPVDKLHWQAFRACDRLLVFLPPDAAYLKQAEQILPATLRAARISPANVDVILTQADRGILSEQFDPIMQFMAKHSHADEAQGSRALIRRQPHMDEKHLRMLERHLGKLMEDNTLRGKLEEEVRAMLKACGLEDKLAGILPDALPLMRALRRQNRLLLPALMQREFINTAYATAIRDLLGAWVQVASNVPQQRR